MICPSCGQEVADNAPSCPHCGKIFTNHPQENKITENKITFQPSSKVDPPKEESVSTMPTTTFAPQKNKNQEQLEVYKAVRLRRKQRWFFYALIIVLFLIAVGLLVKTYNDNTALINQINGINDQLKQSQDKLSQSSQQLDATNTSLSMTKKQLQEREAKLKEISKAQINLYNLIMKSGLKIDKKDLKKIPYAKVTVPGPDTDNDGLADEVEQALGTDKSLTDTDNDGYSDYNELLQGYNPLGTGNLGLDTEFAAKYKGRLLLQEKGLTYAWYVGDNGQRYYLGNSGDNFATMSKLKYWSEK